MLSGELVQLRERRDDDESVLYGLAAELETWEERGPLPPAPLTRAAFHTMFSEPPGAGVAHFVITVDRQVVGRCDLFGEDAFSGHAELGIAILADARGHGYGTDALRVLVDYAFTRRNLHRVHLTVLATNAAALASYAKVGFVTEGVLREHAWVRGEYVDEVQLGLLRSQWTRPLTG